MADVLELVAFGLPPTFPPEAVPEPGALFVAACWPGMTKGRLLTRARRRGWRPSWEHLPEVVAEAGIEVYGFALLIDGCVVPLMAACGESSVSSTDQGRQSPMTVNWAFF